MRSLVTGAAGFIGSRLSRRLVAEGHEVVGLDDLSEGRLENLADVPEIRFAQTNLRDADAVQAAAHGCDAIFHQGAMKSVPRSIEEPERFTEVNVLGTLNVLLAARDATASVVFASSSSVYGDQDRFPLTEDMPPRPLSPYAATKLTGEAYSCAWWESFGVPTVALRYFNVYGPGQDPASEYAAVVPRFIAACLTGERPTIYGDGEQARDFTFIDDVVEANLLAARAPDEARGRAFNIGGGAEPTSVNRLLELIGSSCGVQPDPMHEPARVGDIRRSEADVGLARALLGFEPKVGVADGLRRTVDWFRGRV
ncbi:MAG: NAD-dependent epimerase/dehydratase family protein [Actinomycetota bacterium]